MTIERKSSGYDPGPKKRRKALILFILAFLGLSKEEDIPPIILGWLLWKTTQDIIRDLQTDYIKVSGLATSKDWVTHPEDSATGVCDYCQSMADGGPYPLEYDAETHPNCKCEWVPHSE
jgi:hypothetical protein